MNDRTPSAALGPAHFAPQSALAEGLLPHAISGDDGSHDLAHIHRVFRNAMRIAEQEGGDRRILAAAVLLHDCVAVEKSSPLRSQASRLAAEKATDLLSALDWEAPDIAAVAHAITAHSFSANIAPETLEANILQDADRLDAIGMIGAARCFYTAGRMGSALYDPVDPQAEHRALDDRPLPSTISRQNCSSSPTISRPLRAPRSPGSAMNGLRLFWPNSSTRYEARNESQ